MRRGGSNTPQRKQEAQARVPGMTQNRHRTPHEPFPMHLQHVAIRSTHGSRAFALSWGPTAACAGGAIGVIGVGFWST